MLSTVQYLVYGGTNGSIIIMTVKQITKNMHD